MELATITEDDCRLSREPAGRELDACTSFKGMVRTGDSVNDIEFAYAPIIICDVRHRLNGKSVFPGALDYRLGAVTPHRRVDKVLSSHEPLKTDKTQSIADLRAGESVPAGHVSIGPAKVPVTDATIAAGIICRRNKRVPQAISCPKVHFLQKEEFYG